MKANASGILKSITQIYVLSHLICLFSAAFVFGQQTRVYEGDYLLSNELEGEATYQYKIENGLQIKDGPFEFSSLGDQQEFKEKYLLEGSYHQNKKSGKWKFSHYLLKADADEFIVDYSIQKTSSGKVHYVEGDFKAGKPHGKWSSLTLKIEKSVVVDTLNFVRAEFDNGNFIGKVQAKNKVYQLAGEIDDNSFLNGEWILFQQKDSKAIIDYRNYNAGMLTANSLELEGKRHFLNNFSAKEQDLVSKNFITISFDKKYIAILEQSTLGKKTEGNKDISTEFLSVQTQSNQRFLEVFNVFRKYNELHIWGKDTAIKLPKVKVKKYPYTKEELEIIKQSAPLVTETNQMLLDFLNDAQVKISLNANDSIAKYHVVYAHYKTAFSNLKSVFDALDQPAFEYVNRSVVIPQIFNGIDYPETIQFETRNTAQSLNFDFPSDVESDQSNIAVFYDQLKEINQDLKKFSKVVQPILSQEKQREHLAEDEARLVEKRDSILLLFDTDNNDLNDYQLLVAKEVVNYVEEQFKLYAQQSIEEKVESLRSTLICFDQMISLHAMLDDMPEKLNEIKVLYTRTVWNPFTMTDMDEIVKEDVYQAYREILLDHYLTILESRINCLGLESAMDNFDELFNKMITLREQDTQKLEKKVKRESDPETLIEAFELNKIKSE
ncbi:hypothetical protein [Brumimicrobium aurantiacum]|uniref:Uncharacterized protein n=1 Tax=Brumimicrobium aurantiacum TaxID=1737063 RepID=A0A3E1F1J9_9FLAO|nr:hypothetical protein [Brumimicrobium aurantiacum]RFC55685.1 hypothetical protein DXU93_01760 [Brumimicrobium aurantiacum]